MKITAYEVRPDEGPVIQKLCDDYGIEVVMTSDIMSEDNYQLAEGADGITTLGQSHYSEFVLDHLKEYGVKVLAARCIGVDSMNLPYARKLGFRICHGSYGPEGVAEYTIMSILMCLRKMKKAMYNTDDNDYMLKGKMGSQIGSKTIGVLGTGKIGFTVIKLLSGFGCRILANDVYENDAVREYAEYVDLDTLYRESDVITLHCPLMPSTEKMINKEALAKMKDGVVLVNNARGGLVDIDDIIEALENGKIGQLYMDAFPGEEGIIHLPHNEDIVTNKWNEKTSWLKLKYCRSFINVIHTPHMAFFTEEAGAQMCDAGISGIYEVLTKGESKHEVPEDFGK